jgi:predicted phospho-2-dehydro-3-deoxyheptonate aldolase
MIGSGKTIRINRLFNNLSGNSIIVPIDHGVTLGPIDGVINIRETVYKLSNSGVNAIIIHGGLFSILNFPANNNVGYICHLSASTIYSRNPNYKVLVNTVENAVAIGADAISIQVNIGDESETEMLKDLGRIAADCNRWGMPLLAMMYVKLKNIEAKKKHRMIKHAVRIGAELGANIIKTVYTGDTESFSEIVHSCPVPVLIAGGEKLMDREIFKMISEAMSVGAKGVCIGRNIFQHETPGKFIQAASEIINHNLTAEKAFEMIAKDAINN